MSILTASVFGIRLWILLYFMSSIVMFIGVILYWKREFFRKKYYSIRFPEKVIRVVIHYKTGLYRVFYRIIPHDDLFRLEKGLYYYDKDVVRKEHDIFVAKGRGKDEDSKILVVKNIFTKSVKGKDKVKFGDTEEYDYQEYFQIKEKGKKYPEIHYMHRVPNPISFDFEHKKLDFSSTQLKDFKDNDLLQKLLAMKGQKSLMMLMFLAIMVNIGITAFLMARSMGWIQ